MTHIAPRDDLPGGQGTPRTVPRGFAPANRWVVLGSGAAALLTMTGVLMFSADGSRADLIRPPSPAIDESL